jgi:hypothetical protein
VTDVQTDSLNGGVTGGTDLTSLDGNGLTVDGNSLGIKSGTVGSDELTDDSVTVAGNSVALGGSTGVDYVDLGDTGSSFPVPNGDLSNDSVTVAGNAVSLGGSTDVDYVDLTDTGSSFPIPNGDLANSSVTVTAGAGLKSGGSASLGGSTTLDVEPADFAGTTLEDDGSDNLTVSSGSIGTDELATNFSNLAALFGNTPKVGGSGNLTANIISAASDQNDGKLFLEADEEVIFQGEGSSGPTLTFGVGTTIGTSLEPDANDVYDIGFSSSRWSNIYLTNNPNVSSDARLKESITELTDGLDRLEQVRPVSYEWKDREDSDRQLGFIAQELEGAVPEAVTRPDDDRTEDAEEGGDADEDGDSDEDGYLGVTYEMVLPVAVDAIQTQQERIEDLEAENECLRERVADLESRLGAVETQSGLADQQGVADD